jgi:glyoxylase-like metal-dependent hydrolase (beta-lactamase superfamily II)
MSESRPRVGTASVARVEFEVEFPPGHVACYVVDAGVPVLVDAGMPDDRGVGGHGEAFREGLADHGYELADIGHLVVTHPHVDHIGQVPAVLEAAEPTVHAPVGVRERFARDADRLAARIRENAAAAGLSGDRLESAVEMGRESLERDRTLLPPTAVDHWVDPGETFRVGELDLTATHTPGHQADHLVYAADVDGERALLAGDAGIQPFRPVVIHDGLDDAYRDAFAAFYRGLDRLDALDPAPDRVYPGHGPVHDDLAGIVERDRGSLQRRLDGVREQVADGVRTAPGVAMAIAGDDRSVRYLLPEAMSALAHLEREGAVVATVEDGVRYFDPA